MTHEDNELAENLSGSEGLIDWIDGVPHFRGLPLHEHRITIGERELTVLALADAADLLDQPEFAEEFVERDRAPFGLELWPAASMLAEAIVKSEPGEGRPALDLGCGLGLVAMVATLQGWRVKAADHDPIALRFAEHNAIQNGIKIADFIDFNWHAPPSNRTYQRVFGADVLYQQVDHLPVLKCLRNLLGIGGMALLADPNRSVADGFASVATGQGFEVNETKSSASNFRGDRVDGRILRIQRKP